MSTIDDLLDFSKIEAGKLDASTPASFSLRSEVGQTLGALSLRAQRKRLELCCDVATGTFRTCSSATRRASVRS